MAKSELCLSIMKNIEVNLKELLWTQRGRKTQEILEGGLVSAWGFVVVLSFLCL